jgi:hypothetical protein
MSIEGPDHSRMMDHTLFEDANQRVSLVINAPGEFSLKIWRRRKTTWLTAMQVAEIAERMLAYVGSLGPTGPVGPSGHMAAQEPHNGTS